ncbi:MAG: DNA-processing protein DprA [Bacilli bacterium]
MIKGRDIIIHLAIKYEGDWNRIYEAIKAKEPATVAEVGASMEQLKSETLTIIDDDYPENLKRIYKPPFVLFYHGDKSLLTYGKASLAVIGSRKPSPYGEAMTRAIVKDLVAGEILIVSGLARGIDHIAHQTTLAADGKTIAVLGSGINRPYPEETKVTYEKIKQRQLVLSEYPDRVEPHKDNFPWRNRIIAGLAQAVFVTEARHRSGTLITVGYALYLGKDVYVLPHPANVESSCNRLIRDGAVLVESAHDILEELGKVFVDKNAEPDQEPLPKNFI